MRLGRDQVITIGRALNRRHALGAAADGANRVSQRRATTAGSTVSAKGTGLRILLHAQPGQLCTPGLRRQRWAFGGRPARFKSGRGPPDTSTSTGLILGETDRPHMVTVPGLK